MKVGFLHTAPTHVELFDNLVQAIAPKYIAKSSLSGLAGSSPVDVQHLVDASLLEYALSCGVDSDLETRTEKHLAALIEHGCDAVACTCSTLGAFIERMVIGTVSIQRIDRAAADALMKFDRVLVLSAIESAAQAAEALMASSAVIAQTETKWSTMLVPNAWQFFQAGQLEAYDSAVSDFANQFLKEYDAVFLSQASMQGAQEHCQHEMVITSPKPGVEKLLEVAAISAS